MDLTPFESKAANRGDCSHTPALVPSMPEAVSPPYMATGNSNVNTGTVTAPPLIESEWTHQNRAIKRKTHPRGRCHTVAQR